MTTRLGALYKRTVMTNQGDEESRMAVAAKTRTVGLSGLVRMLLDDWRRWDKELAQERRGGEAKMRWHKTEMQEQMDMIKKLVRSARLPMAETGTSTAAKDEHRTPWDKLVLTKFEEGEDVEVYLTAFKCVMTVHSVNRSHWAIKLAPQLSG